jgi:hypothetical protein
MSKDELIRRLQISCLGLDPIDPLRLLVDDVIAALAQSEQDHIPDARKMVTEQEPGAVVDANDEGYWADILPDRNVKVGQLLYTTPPQRTWVGLEGEEIRNLWEEATKPDRSTMTMVTSFAKSIEAKLKEKNT